MAGKTKTAAPQKVCDKCFELNAVDADNCVKCGATRFAPSWVRQLRKVTRNFSLQVTDPHPSSESKQNRLTLYKWWPGGKATFNIATQSHWDQVKTIVDSQLAPFLGWKTADEIASELRSATTAGTSDPAETAMIIGQHSPDFVVEVVKNLKLDGLAEEDLAQAGRSVGQIAQILLSVDERHRLAIQEVVKKLPSQGSTAINQLADLMEELTVGQIAAVAGEVQRRVGFLKLFRDRINDERTYEITGDGSIHRLLEQAMWIVDERYWLMHSNRQLRTIVTQAMVDEDKKLEKKRPDFVCGVIDNKLIVIEIKRPSHTLAVADLNQLEKYVVLCQQYEGTSRGFEAILVGTKMGNDLERTLKVRSNSFKVRTYTQLMGDCERRYSTYLKALEPEVGGVTAGKTSGSKKPSAKEAATTKRATRTSSK